MCLVTFEELEREKDCNRNMGKDIRTMMTRGSAMMTRGRAMMTRGRAMMIRRRAMMMRKRMTCLYVANCPFFKTDHCLSV